MPEIRKILVPVDFSDSSTDALSFAADLARRYEAELVLLHVCQLPAITLPEGMVLPGPETTARIFDRAAELLASQRVAATNLGAPAVTTATAQGVTFVEIVRAAREGGFDLIVMGTHGRTGVRHALIGSV